MSNFRMSIRALLICIIWIAVSIASVQSASIWWASITFSMTLLVLTAMVVSLIVENKSYRAFRLGFAIVGIGYFAFVFLPYLDRQIGHRLITTKLFAWVQPMLHEDRPTSTWYGGTSSEIALNKRYLNLVLRSSSGEVQLAAPQWDPFQQICHSLITIPFACLGGLFTSICQRPVDAT